MDNNKNHEKNNRNYQNITSCLLCDSTNLKKLFSVGEVYLTGYFPLKDENDFVKTSVGLSRCSSCNNVQAQELVEADLIGQAKKMMDNAVACGREIPVPTDVVVGKMFSADVNVHKLFSD